MRADIERRLKRLERAFAAQRLRYVVRLVCMCGWPSGSGHVCRPDPPPPRPGVIVLGLD